jgi:hypothetical protein
LVDGKKAENYALPLDGDWALEATTEDDKALCWMLQILETFPNS